MQLASRILPFIALRSRLLTFTNRLYVVMRSTEMTRWLLVFGISVVVGDLLGPTYSALEDLCSDQSLVRSAWANITSAFDTYLRYGENSSATAGVAGNEHVARFAGLFSIHDAGAVQLQYYYIVQQVASSVNGTNDVDGDSIYRVASVTKLMASTTLHRPCLIGVAGRRLPTCTPEN